MLDVYLRGEVYRISPEAPVPVVRVRERRDALFDNYLRTVTPNKGLGKQQHDRRCAAMFLRVFGRDRKARLLSRRERDLSIAERRRGTLRPDLEAKARTIGDRVVVHISEESIDFRD
jgi:bifunctional ADP-heptose synthase (sugar kinase/adenylyltransferase)